MIFDVGWPDFTWIISFHQLIYSKVHSIIPIFQRRRQRLEEPPYLAKVTQSVQSIFLFHNIVSPMGLAQGLACRAHNDGSLVMEGPSMWEWSPSFQHGLQMEPVSASGLISLCPFSWIPHCALASPTMRHEPQCLYSWGSLYQELWGTNPKSILGPLLQEDLPDFHITPAFFAIFVLTHPSPICRHSNTIPNNHYPCLYLPLFVAPWRAGAAPYSSLFTESSTQGLIPEKHSVHKVGVEFTLGKKTAKIFKSQSLSALPCYEPPISLSIHWRLHRAFLWVMTLHLYSHGNKRCRDLECPPVYPHHQEFIKPNAHVIVIFIAFQITG